MTFPHKGAPRVAVVGAGRWGKNLIRNFNDLDALEVICDTSTDAIGVQSSVYPEVRTSDDWRELLEDPAIDAAAIAVPPAAHAEVAVAFARAGKAIYVEKPLALSVSDARAIVDAAELAGVPLMVGHLLHYHPAVEKLLEIIQGGELGQIQYLYSHRLNLGTIRHDENALWNFAPHDISIVLAAAGLMPDRVSATGGDYLQPGISDVSISNLSFPGGVRAHIFVSWLHPFKVQRMTVVGSEGMAVFDDLVTPKLVCYDKGVTLENGRYIASQPEGRPIDISSEEPLRRECAHFLDVVQNGGRPKTDGLEGLRVMEVLAACTESLEHDGNWVELGDDEPND
jgi:UDP-2-acetamido-3-amino-2,3-dideoxy-glucuronate N-acetyltransferase